MNWWMFVKCERPTASPMDIINKMSEIGSLIECQCRSRAQDKEPSSTPKLTGDADENRRFSDCKFVCLASKSPPIHNVDTYIYIYAKIYYILCGIATWVMSSETICFVCISHSPKAGSVKTVLGSWREHAATESFRIQMFCNSFVDHAKIRKIRKDKNGML